MKPMIMAGTLSKKRIIGTSESRLEGLRAAPGPACARLTRHLTLTDCVFLLQSICSSLLDDCPHFCFRYNMGSCPAVACSEAAEWHRGRRSDLARGLPGSDPDHLRRRLPPAPFPGECDAACFLGSWRPACSLVHLLRLLRSHTICCEGLGPGAGKTVLFPSISNARAGGWRKGYAHQCDFLLR